MSPGVIRSPVLELYDLDGTLTTPSFQSAEGEAYLGAAAHFVVGRIPSYSDHESDLVERLHTTIMRDVFPYRHRPNFWAQFPTVQNKLVGVCPSVDHYLLTQFGTRVLLEREAREAGAGSSLAFQIDAFLGNAQWANEMYGFASHASLPHARMDDGVRDVLEDRLAKGALIAIFTNSSLTKAREVARKGGLERHIVEEKLERGKLALVGNGRKAVIDEQWSIAEQPAHTRWGSHVDVSEFFGEKDGTVIVDLRRRPYYDRVAELMRESGARSLWMVDDMVALGVLPVANWLEFSPTVVMRQTSMSAVEEIRVVQGLIGARVVQTLPEAVSELG